MSTSALRPFFAVAALGATLSAHAGIVLIHGFDVPFSSGPISISTGTGAASAYEDQPSFLANFDATIDANADSTGVERLLLRIDDSQLKYSTDSDVDGSMRIRLSHIGFTGPFGYLGHDLGNTFTALHLDFGQLDHDLAVSFTGGGQSGRGLELPGTFSGAGTVAAGTTGIDIPLSSSTGRVSLLQYLFIDIDAPAGTDFHLSGVSAQAVPEPASLAALGLGAAAALRRRRR